MIIPKIIILKPGANENSTDIRDYRFHSNFSFLKGYYDDIHSMTINAGDTEKIITIPHGLTYVPEVDVFHDTGSGLVQLPYRLKTISGYDKHFFCSADSTNIYIKWKSAIAYNQEIINTIYLYDDTRGYDNALAGNVLGDSKKCIMTFGNNGILQGDSIYSATLNFYISHKNIPNQDVYIRTYGIDVDEMVTYTDFGLSKTTATVSQSVASEQGSYFGINVKDIVQEIVNRPGWVNNSQFGFYVEDNSSVYDRNILDDDYKSYLSIIKSGSVTYNFRVLINKDKIA